MTTFEGEPLKETAWCAAAAQVGCGGEIQLSAAAAGFRTAGRDSVGLPLVLVGKGLQCWELAGAVSDCLGQ